MPIKLPDKGWDRFKKTTGPWDLALAGGGTLAAAVPGVRFLYNGEPHFGIASLVVAALILGMHLGKAKAAVRQLEDAGGLHEMMGCLHTLETVLLGPDVDPKRRGPSGLRLTVYIPEGTELVQVCDYVGDQRVPGKTAGRKLPQSSGAVGKAYRQAQLNPHGQQDFCVGQRDTENYDAFILQMTTEYSFTNDAARKLSPATRSWLAFAVTGHGKIHGVLYCDSKEPNFFTPARQTDLLHAMVGFAYYVGLRYP